MHTYALLAPALGLARGGYADFTEWTRKRYLTYTQLAIAQHVPVQIKIAEIAAQIDAAELLARRCLATARADYAGMSMETRTLLRRDWAYAMKMLRDAMDALVKISGSSGLMEDNPVQRCWRDVHAISSHVVMNWDVPAENFGRMEFGLPLNPPIRCSERRHPARLMRRTRIIIRSIYVTSAAIFGSALRAPG